MTFRSLGAGALLVGRWEAEGDAWAAVRSPELELGTWLPFLKETAAATAAAGERRFYPHLRAPMQPALCGSQAAPVSALFQAVHPERVPSPVVVVVTRPRQWEGPDLAPLDDLTALLALYTSPQDSDSPDGVRQLEAALLEAQRVETALRASEARFRSLIDNASDLVYTHDLAGNILSFNAAGQRMLGYTLDELLRMNVMQIVAPNSLEVVRERARQRTERGNADRLAAEVELLSKDGRPVPVEVSSSAILVDGKMVGVQGIARDVRERRRLEEQLRQSQKLEAVGRLAGGIAHDFNNMLAVITGYSELVLSSLGPDHRDYSSVQQVKRSADRAAELTRQLLAFSRKQLLQPRILDMNEVVTEMERMLRRLIGEDVELVRDPALPLWPISADPGQLGQVIVNLAVNARDAMPNGGRLTLSLTNTLLESTGADGDAQPRRWVELTIADTGIGMDGETRDHIFEPFFTTKEVGQGTGLGLATVYGIIQQSGGQIRVESSPGCGSTFRIYLPAVEEGQEPLPEAAPAQRGIVPRAETILLVEDEAMVRELLTDVLRAQGYSLLVAVSAEHAVRLSAVTQGRIDLLVTDVVLPQQSGPELARQITSQRPETRVLFISGYTDDAVARYGLGRSGAPFLQKPFTPTVLTAMLEEILGSGASG